MLPGELDCWYHDMGINYNSNNDTYSNNKGVNVRPLDWGGLSGIDYLDRIFGVEVGSPRCFFSLHTQRCTKLLFPTAATAYFGPLIKNLEAVGYTPGKNLRGAPVRCHWPLAPSLVLTL